VYIHVFLTSALVVVECIINFGLRYCVRVLTDDGHEIVETSKESPNDRL
jgi:hypothetical protein